MIELEAIARSRTEWACRVQRARILLAYHANPSTYAVGEAIGVTHQTVQRCLDRAVRFGVMAALDDSPRPGKAPKITDDANAWLVSLACQKAKDLGYPHELWTTRLLARHVREHRGPPGILAWPTSRKARSARSSPAMTSSRIRFATIWNGVTRRSSEDGRGALRLSRGRGAACGRGARPAMSRSSPTTRSRASRRSATPHPTCRRSRGSPTFARDHEYKRHGTLSLLAGIDLLTGKVHACVEDRHRSREFVSFLKQLDAAYPADTAIKLLLDNHSAHTSKETRAWLATRPEGRFTLVFTPKHGSWLNLVEGFFSKMARSVLRHIRVASKAELKARILAYLEDINAEPVVHTWTYKIGEAA